MSWQLCRDPQSCSQTAACPQPEQAASARGGFWFLCPLVSLPRMLGLVAAGRGCPLALASYLAASRMLFLNKRPGASTAPQVHQGGTEAQRLSQELCIPFNSPPKVRASAAVNSQGGLGPIDLRGDPTSISPFAFPPQRCFQGSLVDTAVLSFPFGGRRNPSPQVRASLQPVALLVPTSWPE